MHISAVVQEAADAHPAGTRAQPPAGVGIKWPVNSVIAVGYFAAFGGGDRVIGINPG